LHVAFRDKTRATVRVVASSAEEYPSDGLCGDVMRADLAAAQQAGDCVAVCDKSGQLVASTPCTAAQGQQGRELAVETLSSREPEPSDTRVYQFDGVGDGYEFGGLVVDGNQERSLAPLGQLGGYQAQGLGVACRVGQELAVPNQKPCARLRGREADLLAVVLLDHGSSADHRHKLLRLDSAGALWRPSRPAISQHGRPSAWSATRRPGAADAWPLTPEAWPPGWVPVCPSRPGCISCRR
jgi:hypothetical protein